MSALPLKANIQQCEWQVAKGQKRTQRSPAQSRRRTAPSRIPIARPARPRAHRHLLEKPLINLPPPKLVARADDQIGNRTVRAVIPKIKNRPLLRFLLIGLGSSLLPTRDLRRQHHRELGMGCSGIMYAVPLQEISL